MEDKETTLDRIGAIEGADSAAMGTAGGPESAPAAAEIQDDVRLVPGANYDEMNLDEPKPWSTTLAYGSGQAGVANDPPDAQEPEFPTDPDDPR